jgi:putative tricarboxylic transport membrane protein
MGIDRLVGCGAFVGGLAVAFVSYGLGLGDFRMPGPGAWPFILGVVFAVLGGWLWLHPAATPAEAEQGKSRWAALTICLVSFFAYAFLLEPMGYLVATTLVMIVQLRWVEGRTWTVALSTSVLAAVISFVMFGVWLKVPLPPGIIPIRVGY